MEINGIPWESFKSESYRLVTFLDYPVTSTASAIVLAAKGFAFLQEDHVIMCCFCQIRLDVEWSENDIDELHKRNYNCPMSNIPMDQLSLHREKTLFTTVVSGGRNDGDPLEVSAPTLMKTSGDDEDGFSVTVPAVTSVDEICPPTLNDVENYSTSWERLESSQTENKNSSGRFDEPDSVYTPSYCNTDSPKPDTTSGQQTNARHNHTQQRNTQQNNTKQNNTQQNSTQLNNTHHNNAQQNTTLQNNTQQNTTPQNNTQQNTTPQNNTQQNITQQNTIQSNNTQQNSAQQNSSGQQQSTEQGADSNQNENAGETTNYEKLGIITARPRRPELAALERRMETFKPWPKIHHLKPEIVAKAGFFYTGYSDCSRCFYCGGAVRNWEEEDDVWVEHARWFPKCGFLIQEVGKDFINTVLDVKQEKDEITFDDVQKRMIENNLPIPSKFDGNELEGDPAVRSLVDNGLDKHVVTELMLEFKKRGQIVSSDILYETAKERHLEIKEAVPSDLSGEAIVSLRKKENPTRDKELMDTLRKDIQELRKESTCKMCYEAERNTVLLPCRHLSTCTQCSHAVKACPVCQDIVRGVVKADLNAV